MSRPAQRRGSPTTGMAYTRKVHGDGDDNIIAVTAVTAVMGLFYDRRRGNCGDGDSIHSSTAGAVDIFAVKPQ